jgi:hypothetical protein
MPPKLRTFQKDIPKASPADNSDTHTAPAASSVRSSPSRRIDKRPKTNFPPGFPKSTQEEIRATSTNVDDEEYEAEQVRVSENQGGRRRMSPLRQASSRSPPRTEARPSFSSEVEARMEERKSGRTSPQRPPSRLFTRSPKRPAVSSEQNPVSDDELVESQRRDAEKMSPFERVALMKKIARFIPKSGVSSFAGINTTSNETLKYYDGVGSVVRPDILRMYAKTDKLHEYLFGLKYEGDGYTNPFTEELLVFALNSNAFRNAALIYMRIPTIPVKIGDRTKTFKDDEGKTHTVTEEVMVNLRKVNQAILELAVEKKQIAMVIHMLENYGAPPPRTFMRDAAKFMPEEHLFEVIMEYMTSKGYIETTARPSPDKMRRIALQRRKLMEELISIN